MIFRDWTRPVTPDRTHLASGQHIDQTPERHVISTGRARVAFGRFLSASVRSLPESSLSDRTRPVTHDRTRSESDQSLLTDRRLGLATGRVRSHEDSVRCTL